ncbi:MAG: hypothetical protein QXI84_10235 [Thermofilaceae archaeon]
MRVADVLGTSTYTLLQYGVSPDDDINTAIEKLNVKAPHIAEFLKRLVWRLQMS